jgi:glycosyltransferase involved in cell wall biosynthesis
MPLVSVVIPTYNYGRYLPETIDSVLGQTYADREIIVIDDGSTDDTAEIIRRYGDKVIYLAQANTGLPATRNRGCAVARGEYFAFLDADDVWLPNKLEVQVRALERNPDIGMVCGSMNRIDIDSRPLPGPKPSDPPGETTIEMLERGTALPSTWMIRRSCFEGVGGFDEQLTSMEDYEFALRVAMHCKVACLPEVLVNYRVHSDSLSNYTELMVLGYLQVFEKLLREWDDPAMKRIMRRSQAQYRYRMAKIRFHAGETGSARRLIVQALAGAPTLAWPHGKPMPLWRRPIQMLRPYGFLLGLCLAPGAVRSMEKSNKAA